MKEQKRFSLNFNKDGRQNRKTIFQNFLEVSTVQIASFYLGVGELSPCVQDIFRSQIAPAIISGERRRLSLDARLLLSDFKIVEDTKSNIPQDGRPKLIVGNHWDKGPLHGRWPAYLISKAVIDVLGDSEANEVRWIMQDALELTVPLAGIRTGRPVPASEDILDRIIKSYNLFKVKAPFKEGKRNNNHDTLHVVKDVGRVYDSGVPIGLYPEAKGTITLGRGHWRSGFLVSFLARKNRYGWILPVGQWNEGRTLHLNFGEPLSISAFASFKGKEGYQKAANLLMRHIAPLVPEKYRGRF